MNGFHAATLPRPISVEDAREHIAASALSASALGPVGLELEFHVVDLAQPARRVTWTELSAVAAEAVPPGGSAITIEPGGQVELSGPPAPDVYSAIDALRRDERHLRAVAANSGLALAPIGADPARPVGRVAPHSRYVAMERHFGAMGCGAAGQRMMTSTAALQVNVEAGPQREWAARLQHLDAIGPVLAAVSACSPTLAGDRSGWASMRAEAWHGIDHARTAAFASAQGEPAEAWAEYALAAPVMLVRDEDGATAATKRVPLRQWIEAPTLFGRAPTRSDVDYHLTTLFPPVRARGYLELRFLDAVPDAWWPALAAITVTLADCAPAAQQAAQVCSPLSGRWLEAGRSALSHPDLRAAAVACIAIAAEFVAPALRADVERYGELVARGRTPGDDLQQRIDADGPAAALAEAARA